MKFTIKTKKKDEVVDITDDVQSLIEKSGQDSGMIVLNVLHTTCGLTTADLDPGTDEDYLETFRKLLPNINYRHPHDPAHTPDHILSTLIGTNLSINFENGELTLGTWQRIILVELNGPREREISYQII